MKYTENALNVLTAKSFKGIGNAWIVKNMIGGKSIDAIISLLNNKIKEKTNFDEFMRLRDGFEKKINQKFQEWCDGFVALGDNDFPQHRGNVKESEQPVFLYYKGDIGLLSIENKNIAVIGLLKPEGDIEERERNIVSEFVNNAATIVSGLALGCDSIAHQETLCRNGKTIAILPSPLDNIMPATNKGLAYKIACEGGLLMTEYGTDFKSKMELSSRYKERDRLQALFSDGIVLAASYAQNSAKRWHLEGQKLDSGARLAMEYARDYNIPRAVMYDSVLDKDNPMFDLNRDIIHEQKSTSIISQDNFKEIVPMLMKNARRATGTAQKNLFD